MGCNESISATMLCFEIEFGAVLLFLGFLIAIRSCRVAMGEEEIYDGFQRLPGVVRHTFQSGGPRRTGGCLHSGDTHSSSCHHGWRIFQESVIWKV